MKNGGTQRGSCLAQRSLQGLGITQQHGRHAIQIEQQMLAHCSRGCGSVRRRVRARHLWPPLKPPP